MTEYKAAVGHNVAEISLTPLDPQPRSMGIRPTRRAHPISGKSYEDALYVELEYSVLEDADQYEDVLEYFGLDDADEENVTVYVRDERWQWVRKNGIAHRPEIGKDARWQDYFPRNIVILITDLEDPS